jgi:hypothetical protein
MTDCQKAPKPHQILIELLFRFGRRQDAGARRRHHQDQRASAILRRQLLGEHGAHGVPE